MKGREMVEARVGMIGKTRGGLRVECLHLMPQALPMYRALWMHNEGVVYATSLDGRYMAQMQHDFDIVSEWTEPPLRIVLYGLYETRDDGRRWVSRILPDELMGGIDCVETIDECGEEESYHADGTYYGSDRPSDADLVRLISIVPPRTELP